MTENKPMSTIDSENNNGSQIQKNSDSNLMAALSYIWIISIVMLVIKKDDKFVSFHAKQGTVIFAFSIIALMITPVIFFLGVIISIAVSVADVIGFIKALSGEKYKMPFIGDLAEKIKI